jgi:hypothetical protein
MSKMIIPSAKNVFSYILGFNLKRHKTADLGKMLNIFRMLNPLFFHFLGKC